MVLSGIKNMVTHERVTVFFCIQLHEISFYVAQYTRQQEVL